MKKTLLWVGDANCPSGFAQNTHGVLETLRHSFKVVVVGINALGGPHNYPYDIWPAAAGGDLFGVNLLKMKVLQEVKPDVVVLQNDPWNVGPYIDVIKTCPVVATLAVDGLNCQGHRLNRLALSIFWTKFGEREARRGGYTGRSTVIPLGVDLNAYKPMDKSTARHAIGIPHKFNNAFIIGNVNRNQPRKRMDLCVCFFAEWITTRSIEDAYLYLHVAPTGEDAFDLGQLMEFYGFHGDNLRLMTSEPEVHKGLSVEKVCATYNAFDVMLTTTQGEGWGLTTMEGMACGTPQIVPRWAALGEWCEDAVIQVPCSEIAVTPTVQLSKVKINVVGGIIDRQQALSALDKLYKDRAYGEELGETGRQLVSRPEFRWEAIGKAYEAAIQQAIFPEQYVIREAVSA